MSKTVTMYRGVPISNLSREQLIAALETLGNQIDDMKKMAETDAAMLAALAGRHDAHPCLQAIGRERDRAKAAEAALGDCRRKALEEAKAALRAGLTLNPLIATVAIGCIDALAAKEE